MATIIVQNRNKTNPNTYWMIASVVAFLLVVFYSVSIYQQNKSVSAFTSKPTASGKVNLNNSQTIDREGTATNRSPASRPQPLPIQ